jgi:hypothetical protein
MKEPRVKELIKAYQQGNIIKVKEYLEQDEMIIDPSTWSGYVKKLIDNEHYETAKQTIELTAYKFLKI